MGNPDYSDYWYARQAGEAPPFYDGRPQPGLYSIMKGGDPVRIVDTGDGMAVLVNEQPASNPNKVWMSCGRNDVSFEAYQERLATGRWPGRIGDNNPPEAPEDLLPLEIEKAKEWLAKVGDLKADVQAHEAANRTSAIAALRLKVEKKHDDEKEPHLALCQKIDALYLPKVKAAKGIEGQLKTAVNKYDAGKRAAAIKAQAEREAKLTADKRAADAAWETGQQPQRPVGPPPVEMPPVVAAYGNAVRKVSIKPKVLARIADQDQAYQFFRTDPRVVDLLQKLAQQAVDADILPSGVERVEETVAR